MNAESEVKIISRVIVKPSSPTPLLSRRNLKLSFLDQFLPPFYVPVIFFYQPPHHLSDDINNHALIISQQLKQSLSDSLTLFYPLAGRINPLNSNIDCNDAGAEFVEARVHSLLSDAIKHPKVEELKNYLPADADTIINTADGAPLLAVQANFFDCGGIAIGVCSSHQVTDAASLLAFMCSWAAACRLRLGSGTFSPPSFDLARHFPARDFHFSQSVYVKNEKLVTRRLVFDKEKLAALKRRATASPPSGSGVVVDPTRVEMVSAFMWEHFIEMGKSENLNCAAWHVVNLRARIKSNPEMENVFGNCILKQFFFPNEGFPQFHDLLSKLRNGLREINEDYILGLAGKGGDDYVRGISRSFDLVAGGEMGACGFSSWCRFPVYDVDFGQGKPVWVCPTSCPEKNVTFLMRTRDGNGIEAWVNMLESTSQILETKFKFL